MHRIGIATGTTLTGVVLLVSYTTSVDRLASASSAGATTAASTSSATTAGATGTTATFDGAAASTRFGDVQVRITVTDSVVTASDAITYPNSNGRDQQINSYAIPLLNQEAVAAGSATITMVSGATYTSTGYAQSLQDALDQAGI